MSDTCRVTVLVGPDCLGSGLVSLLRSATGRLDVAVYEVGPSYARMLAEAAERGVAVRLLADDHTGPLNGTLRRLRSARGGDSVAVRVCGGRVGARAHWKLIVAGAAGSGEAAVAVGTGNLDERDAPYRGGRPAEPADPPLAGTRELWVIVEGHADLETAAEAAITSAWRTARRPGEQEPLAVPPHVPPVGDPGTHLAALRLDVSREAVQLAAGSARTGASALANALASARHRALVTVPYVHAGAPEVDGLLGALAGAAARDLDARLLLGADPRGDPASATPARLARLGVTARVMDPLRTTTGHAKLAVVDDLLICGSSNWSHAGLAGNLEAQVAVRHPAAADWVAGVIDHDWRLSGSG
jgi:phosphatidylserine/phosphatidylglycerophosphate/cardiolipin synthase-like enzyme